MFHARIVSPRGSLYFAAELTPYDLENLWTHVQDFQSPTRSTDVRLELTLDDAADATAERHVSALLRRLAADGIPVSLAAPGTQIGAVADRASEPRSTRRAD